MAALAAWLHSGRFAGPLCFIAWIVLLVVAGVPFAGRLSAARVGADNRALVATLAYTDATEAQRAWQPMRGSSPVTVGSAGGRTALRLPCRFVGTDIERASWDYKQSLDLADCRGLAFDVFCPDLRSLGQLNVYFQSGDGWYNIGFQPEKAGAWCTVVVDKARARVEGRPAGWGRVSTMRVSAWRALAADTEIWISNLRRVGVLGVDASVAIVRSSSEEQGDVEGTRQSSQYAEAVAEGLESFGIGCATVAESALTRERLRGAALVALPYNPNLSEEAARAIRDYLELDGGRLLAFYNLPANLRASVAIDVGRHLKEEGKSGWFSSIRPLPGALPGAPESTAQRSWNISELKVRQGAGTVLAEWCDAEGQSTGQAAVVATANCVMMSHVLLKDDPVKKRQLLLAMAGRAAPSLWEQGVRAALERAGHVGNADSFDEAVASLAAAGKSKSGVRTALAAASASKAEAERLRQAGRHAEALERVNAAGAELLEAYCRAQNVRPGEFRGFWCHSAFGVEGMTWDEAIRRLAEAGFTAILPNMLWGGVAFYDSRLLPVSAELAKRGDQIAECLAACRKYGVQIHVWKVNWNTGHRVPPSFLESMRAEGRLQVSSRGKEEPWLCPSHPLNQKLEIDSMVEVARLYAVDGLHFDYIRYPGQDHCFCRGCRDRFAKATGEKIDRWPQSVQREGTLHGKWLDWRRSNIDTVVAAVSREARAVRPGLRVSAAVFRNWATDRDGVGQDWKLWCERGWVDFLCPMDYTESDRVFENWVVQQKIWAGKVPIYPGIGVSSSRTRLPVDRTIDQIEITRRHSTGGFTLFNYGVHESRELLPMLGLGTTASNP